VYTDDFKQHDSHFSIHHLLHVFRAASAAEWSTGQCDVGAVNRRFLILLYAAGFLCCVRLWWQLLFRIWNVIKNCQFKKQTRIGQRHCSAVAHSKGRVGRGWLGQLTPCGP